MRDGYSVWRYVQMMLMDLPGLLRMHAISGSTAINGRDRSNRWFTGAVLGGGAAIGSAITFLFAGGIIWGLVLVARGQLRIRAPQAVKIIAAAFALYFAVDALSILVNQRTMRGLSVLAKDLPFLAFLLIFSRLAFSSRSSLERSVEIGAIAGAIAAAAIAGYQFLILGAERTSGMAGNPGPFALVCAVLYGICIVSSVQRKGMWRLLAVLGALAAAASLALSGMRSLWPVIVIVPLVPLLTIGKTWKARRSYVASIAAVIGILVVTHTLFEQRLQQFYGDILRLEQGDQDSSLGHRLAIWQVGVKLAEKRPLLGYGPGNLSNVLHEYSSDSGEIVNYSHMHNFLLTAQVRSGLLGVGAVLAVLIVPLGMSWRSRHRDATAQFGVSLMIVLVVSYVSSGLLNIMLGHDILDTLYIYGTIVAAYLVHGRPESA